MDLSLGRPWPLGYIAAGYENLAGLIEQTSVTISANQELQPLKRSHFLKLDNSVLCQLRLNKVYNDTYWQ
jgi:hypothetical protein